MNIISPGSQLTPGSSLRQMTGTSFPETSMADTVSISAGPCLKSISRDDISRLFEDTLFKPDWNFKLTNESTVNRRGEMVAGDGSVYVGAYHQLFKLDGNTGKVLWAKEFSNSHCTSFSPDALRSMPVISGNKDSLYAATSMNTLKSLDPSTGEIKWERPCYGNNSHIFTIDDGTVYCQDKSDFLIYNSDGSERARIHYDRNWIELLHVNDSGIAFVKSRGIDAIGPDGKVLWHDNGEAVASFPEAPGIVFLRRSCCFDALDASTGELLWRKMFNGFEPSEFLSFHDNRMIVRDGVTVMCLDAARKGQEIWKKNMVFRDDRIAVGSDSTVFSIKDKTVKSFGPDRGPARWSVTLDLPGNVEDAILSDEGLLFVCDERQIVGIDTATGEISFRYTAPFAIKRIATGKGNSRLLVAGKDSFTLEALNTSGGKILSREPKKAAKEKSLQEPQEIVAGEEFVDIGGVRLPAHQYSHLAKNTRNAQ